MNSKLTLSNWNRIYSNLVRWTIRRISDDSLKFYKDKKKDWIKCLILLDEFESKLFKTLDEINDEFNISADDFSTLCHKYIKKYKNKTIKYFFFTVWTDCRHYLENISNWNTFVKDATKEEIEQARKDFSTVEETFYSELKSSTHTFSDDAKVLEYRGLRMIIDNEWQDAWIKYKGKIHHFQLIWDWYYPIDEFIDLEMN